jgi:hypothetical protein
MISDQYIVRNCTLINRCGPYLQRESGLRIRITFLQIRTQLFPLMRILILRVTQMQNPSSGYSYHFDADPGPMCHSDAEPQSSGDLATILMQIRILCVTQMQNHSSGDLATILMLIRIQLLKMMRIQTDSDPQRWHK